MDVVQVLPAFFSVRLAGRQLRRGQDHRQGRFQLVGGVGDKLLLLLPGLLHRLHREARQPVAYPCQQQQRRQGYPAHPQQQAAHGGLLLGAVGEGQAHRQCPGLAHIPQGVVLQNPLPALLLQSILHNA